VQQGEIYKLQGSRLGQKVMAKERSKFERLWPKRKETGWRRVLQKAPRELGERVTTASLWRGQGVPKLEILSREQGWNVEEFRRKWGGQQDLDTAGAEGLKRDLMVMAMADNTWAMYHAWWKVYEAWLVRLGVDWEEGGGEMSSKKLEGMKGALETSVALMAPEYALGTLELYLAAVQHRFKMQRWGDVKEGTAIEMMMKGVERWKGVGGKEKMKPVEAGHMEWWLRQGQAPRGWRFDGWRGWRWAVSIVSVGWLAGLRPSEVLRLSACDMRWTAGGVAIAVNRTKNDQEGRKRVARVEFGEERMKCPLAFVRRYAVEEGKLVRSAGCTNEEHPTRECRACPRFFENLLASGKVKNWVVSRGLQKARVTFAVKLLYEVLVGEGEVQKEDLRLYSAKSMRVGAVTAAAAGGVRCKVAADHMRMKAEATLNAYDRVLKGEEGEVSRAMHKQLKEAGKIGRK
jgi:hypothetical protein